MEDEGGIELQHAGESGNQQVQDKDEGVEEDDIANEAGDGPPLQGPAQTLQK